MSQHDIRNIHTRRRNILHLMHRYLQDCGFYKSAEVLASEASLVESEYEVCDNIDLDSIYLDFSSFFQLKFGKLPQVLRKIKPQIKLELPSNKRPLRKKATTPRVSPGKFTDASDALNIDGNELQVTIRKIDTEANSSGIEALKNLQSAKQSGRDIVQPVEGEWFNSADWQQHLDIACATILRTDTHCSWSDIFGNRSAIEILKEAVITPMKFPNLFVNGTSPWRSVLLHGPPGTGKTLLARTLYAETRNLQVTFFNLTSSMIISKWRGDSEKILQAIFRLARKHAPSIIFFDEIEGLTSRRDRPSDHEASKRFKNELLQLLDGIDDNNGSADASIFILASTNLPWDIDGAFLRRFEKKVLVQLPNTSERAQMIKKLLPATISCSASQLEELTQISEGFTGDETRLACKEVAMQRVRQLTNSQSSKNEELFATAFKRIRPLCGHLMKQHVEWNSKNGS